MATAIMDDEGSWFPLGYLLGCMMWMKTVNDGWNEYREWKTHEITVEEYYREWKTHEIVEHYYMTLSQRITALLVSQTITKIAFRFFCSPLGR